MLEVLDAVGLEEHQQDEGPEAQDEAIRRVPVLLLGLLWDWEGESPVRQRLHVGSEECVETICRRYDTRLVGKAVQARTLLL